MAVFLCFMNIVDPFLFLIIGMLICLIVWILHQNKEEKNKLINALIAKSPEQLRDLTLADKVEPIKPQETKADLVGVNELNDDEYDQFIADQLK